MVYASLCLSGPLWVWYTLLYASLGILVGVHPWYICLPGSLVGVYYTLPGTPTVPTTLS